LRQQLEHVQARAADLVAAQIQLFELGQRRQMLETDVADLRETDVERLQSGELRDIGEARVGDVGPAQVERGQPPVPAEKRHRRIRDELGGKQIQLFELIERFQTLRAAVRDISERQIQPLQRLDAGN